MCAKLKKIAKKLIPRWGPSQNAGFANFKSLHGTWGGGLMGGHFCGKFLCLRKVAKFSPGENWGCRPALGHMPGGQPACPPRAAMGELGGVHMPMALLGPARGLLGWEDCASPRQSPGAALHWRYTGVAWMGTARVSCHILPLASLAPLPQNVHESRIRDQGSGNPRS